MNRINNILHDQMVCPQAVDYLEAVVFASEQLYIQSVLVS